jgi:hypothetical protein
MWYRYDTANDGDTWRPSDGREGVAELNERAATRAVKGAKQPDPCLPDPCLPDPPPAYTSSDPSADWQRFEEAIGAIVSAPKEVVNGAMEEAQMKRAAKRQGAK